MQKIFEQRDDDAFQQQCDQHMLIRFINLLFQ